MFGSDAFGDETLLDVLSAGGGGLVALGRHTVAALLNSLSVGVDYPIDDSKVQAGFDMALETGDYEGAKDHFASYNEAECPLN